jgi:hypothetical protein
MLKRILLSLCLGLLPSVGRSDITTGLVGHWPMTEGSGTNLADATTNNALTLTNGPTWSAARFTGGFNAVSFDGTDDYAVSANPAVNFDGAGVFTIAFWYESKSTPGGTEGIVAQASTVTASQWLITHQSDDTLGWCWGSGTAKHASTGTVANNTPVHVVAVRSGSSTNWTCTFYFNGVSDGTSGSIGTNASGTDRAVVLGVVASDATMDRDCYLGDVRLYQRALSSGDAAELYASYSGSPPATVRRQAIIIGSLLAPRFRLSPSGRYQVWSLN